MITTDDGEPIGRPKHLGRELSLFLWRSLHRVVLYQYSTMNVFKIRVQPCPLVPLDGIELATVSMSFIGYHTKLSLPSHGVRPRLSCELHERAHVYSLATFVTWQDSVGLLIGGQPLAPWAAAAPPRDAAHASGYITSLSFKLFLTTTTNSQRPFSIANPLRQPNKTLPTHFQTTNFSKWAR